MANDWCGEAFVAWSRAREALASFFSGDIALALLNLRAVTFSVEESDKSTIVSVEDINLEISRGAAYGYDEFGGYYEIGHFESYNFENDSLRSSYPAFNDHVGSNNNNRVVAVPGLADSVELAKHLGVEKLSAMRRYFDRYNLPTMKIWKKAWYLLLEQGDCVPPDKSALFHMFEDLKQIPFPYQLQMVALWDECTNWRILQASAQSDITSSLFDTSLDNRNQVEIEQRTGNLFEDCRIEANSGYSPDGNILGVSMESVRTFLAERLMSAPDEVDWEPLISGEGFEFSVSPRVKQTFPEVNHSRMVWECQRALQNKVSKTSTADPNFASNSELIMLFILSMPRLSIEMEKEKREEGNVNEESRVSGTGNNGNQLGRAHSIVDVSVGVWHACSTEEPQDVQVIIRIDAESGRASLSLQCGTPDTRFKWEDWVNVAMGTMKGYDEAIAEERVSKRETKRLLRKVHIREPVVQLCPFYCDGDDLVVRTGTVGIWMGWRVFDARICKFEIEQWMRACNIDLNNVDDYSAEEEEVWRAEEVIRQVVKSGVFEVDGET